MTTKDTFPVNGGAMSKFNRKIIMARAWEIFRDVYRYPAIKFSSIGWKCFGWALRKAWAQAREAARLAVMPADVKTARIATLREAIRFENFSENWCQARANIAAMTAEIQSLSA